MSGKMNILKSCLIAGMAIAAVFSCSTITEDLQPCGNYVRFTYTYNMKYADVFPAEVPSVDLFVFDAERRFVECRRLEAPFQDGGKTDLRLAPGAYHLVAWAGLDRESYVFAEALVKGVSTPEELTVRMVRRQQEGGAVSDCELHPLWHSEADVEISDGQMTDTVMELVKDTNKLRIIVQADADTEMGADDLDFRVTGANGYLGHDNSLLPDEVISYLPYYQSATALDAVEDTGGINAVVAELNTLRLVENGDMRLTVTHRDGRKIIDIDLIQYLLLTKMEGHQMGAQEYLDRQDEYAMIFFLNSDYMVVGIKINDWIIRPQDGEL